MLVKGHGQGHKVIRYRVIWKGFSSWVLHAKYEVSISYGSKVIAKVISNFSSPMTVGFGLINMYDSSLITAGFSTFQWDYSQSNHLSFY